MAIGGNHFIHIIRRNINISLLIFNNRIYGLTKGQYSPTTPKGSITKTSPDGSIEEPFNPGELVMGSQGSFFARVPDTDPKMMKEVFIKAALHKGTAVVEVLQNCVIFNNDVHGNITGKEVRDDHQIYLKHGERMIFGKNRDKGLVLKNNKLEVAVIGKDGITENDILVHNAVDPGSDLHYSLVRMDFPEFPVAMGIIRSVEKSVYEDLLYEQMRLASETSRVTCMDELLKSGNTYEINETGN
jgi:2-oxoglutarate ferredoxin oxidoreductase subunit beta